MDGLCKREVARVSRGGGWGGGGTGVAWLSRGSERARRGSVLLCLVREFELVLIHYFCFVVFFFGGGTGCHIVQAKGHLELLILPDSAPKVLGL